MKHLIIKVLDKEVRISKREIRLLQKEIINQQEEDKKTLLKIEKIGNREQLVVMLRQRIRSNYRFQIILQKVEKSVSLYELSESFNRYLDCLSLQEKKNLLTRLEASLCLYKKLRKEASGTTSYLLIQTLELFPTWNFF